MFARNRGASLEFRRSCWLMNRIPRATHPAYTEDERRHIVRVRSGHRYACHLSGRSLKGCQDVLRVGTAGDDAPRANLSCRIGKPKYPVGMPGAVRPTPDYVGSLSRPVDSRTRGFLKIRNLLEHGVVQDWDGMEALLKQAFYQGLGTEPTGNSILITEHHLNPTRNRCAGSLLFTHAVSFSHLAHTESGCWSCYLRHSSRALSYCSRHACCKSTPRECWAAPPCRSARA